MESEVGVCPTCSIVHIRVAGDFSGEKLLKVLAEVEAIGGNPESRTEVWDLRALRDLFLSPAHVERLERRLPEWEEEPTGRTVVIARTSTHKSYGTVLCQSLRPYVGVHRSYFSVERATRWLGCSHSAGQGKSCGGEKSCEGCILLDE